MLPRLKGAQTGAQAGVQQMGQRKLAGNEVQARVFVQVQPTAAQQGLHLALRVYPVQVHAVQGKFTLDVVQQ